MWKLFFETCDFLCNFIPNRALRASVRKNQLHNWRKKFDALRAANPDLNFKHVRVIKGGWNIGFIVDNKYVFKIRKNFNHGEKFDRVIREKRITDAFAQIVDIRIPHIDIVPAGEYTFYRYDYIPGVNMNTFSRHTIRHHVRRWGSQIGTFIHQVHNAHPAGIDDLRGDDAGDGWNHNDICNNVIIDPKTMRIVAIIDWEYAGWGKLSTEFLNCTKFSKKIKKSGIGAAIRDKYRRLSK